MPTLERMGKVWRSSTAEVARLRKAVAMSHFFTLPEKVGCLPTEAAQRSIAVELSGHSHSVRLVERGSHPSCLSSAEEAAPCVRGVGRDTSLRCDGRCAAHVQLSVRVPHNNEMQAGTRAAPNGIPRSQLMHVCYADGLSESQEHHPRG